ncbi:MAG: glutathione-disulfide reductase [Kofleriaceae bacterium]|nr:glutathione-disulfide reductase [Kofleriaceae bacterium]
MSKSVDFFVIGGGSGGVRAARIAAQHGASVAVAEESRYGGTCVIRGCIPKKFFVYASEFSHAMEDAKRYGWDIRGSFDWQTLLTNKDERIDRLNGIYINMLKKAGVEILDGRATLRSANEVVVNGEVYQAKHILIATGGRPVRPDIPGAELGITSNEAFHLESLPKRITIVGAGYIGLEFSSIFQGLGVEVSLVHHRKEALRGFDDDIRHQVTENIRKNGVKLIFETEIAEITKNSDGSFDFTCRNGGKHNTDLIMWATGRRPNTENLGLAEAGVTLGKRGEVCIDSFGKTDVDSIYAVGDCTDRLQLTPIAIREGQAVADNLFGKSGNKVCFDHPIVPTAIFTQPEAATVGLTEAQAKESHANLHVYLSTFKPLFHSMSGRDEEVMMKLLVDATNDKVLGFHMVGKGAADVVQTVAIAIGMGATKADFLRTIPLHPCTAEELVFMRTPIER